MLILLQRNKEKVGCIRSGEVSGVSGEHQAAAHLPTTGYRGFSSRHLSSAPSLLQKCQILLTATNTAWSAVLALFKDKMNCSVNSTCYLLIKHYQHPWGAKRPYMRLLHFIYCLLSLFPSQCHRIQFLFPPMTLLQGTSKSIY